MSHDRGASPREESAAPLGAARSGDLRARRAAAVARGVSSVIHSYVDRASGATIVDTDGREWIDFASGIAVVNVGHSAPLVVDAVKAQAERFTHTCFMVAPYEGYVAVCEQLNELTPGAFEKRSALFNSGAEAVENAVKIARYHTKRSAVVVFEHGYHGRTNLTMALTSKNLPYKDGFGPFAPEIYRAPMSYPLHDGLDGKQAFLRVADQIRTQIGAHNVAAVLIEPIQGEGGFVVPAPGFLPLLAEFCREHGIVFIADEIQTGFCRTGDWFASTFEDVTPDLITTAKGIAGGLPLAAVTGQASIVDSVHVGGLGGTYGGNPIACAAALGAIETMRTLDLRAKARRIGEVMLPRLAGMPGVLEVRGRGAMLAIEFADAARATAVNTACHERGLLTLTCGTYGTVMRFLPPLVISDEELNRGLDILDDALAATGAVPSG